MRVSALAKRARLYAWLFGAPPIDQMRRYVTFVRSDTPTNFVLLIADGKELHHDTLYRLRVAVPDKGAVMYVCVPTHHDGRAGRGEVAADDMAGMPLHELWLRGARRQPSREASRDSRPSHLEGYRPPPTRPRANGRRMTFRQSPWWPAALFEVAGTALLMGVVVLSGVRVQLGQGTLTEALLASVMLGLGFGLILWTFGPYTGAQGNPLVSFVATVYGGQPVTRTLAMVSSQLLGAGLVAGIIHAVLPELASSGRDYVPIHMLAECMASFGMLLVALGVAHRQDASVPFALGTFAMASLWMTGRATLGNPVISITVLILSTGWVPVADVLRVLGAQVLGAAIAVGVASFLFPWARESARVLLFWPRQPHSALHRRFGS